MRRSLAKFSESEASNHTPSLADFTTTTPELKFSVHTAGKGSSKGWRRQSRYTSFRKCCWRTRLLRASFRCRQENEPGQRGFLPGRCDDEASKARLHVRDGQSDQCPDAAV